MYRLAVALLFFILISFAGAVDFSSRIVKSRIRNSEFTEVLNVCTQEGSTYTVDRNTIPDHLEISDLCGIRKDESPAPDAPCIEAKLIPYSYDIRDEYGLSPVKYQGSCGSCWAFAAIAALEANVIRYEGDCYNLSEQDLLSCNSQGYDCIGGNRGILDFFSAYGVALERDYPYAGKVSSCLNDIPRYFRTKDWYSLKADSDSIKRCVIKYGPIYTHMRIDKQFRYYSGGIYNHDSSSDELHAVVIIGWNDFMGRDGCWIIKNSWGTSWGDDGFMNIEYGMSSIGTWNACILYQ